MTPLARLSFTASLLRFWLRSGIRGGNRTARFMARRMKSLQAVPIQIADYPPVYMDLRDWGAQDWLKGSPWLDSPREEEEQMVVKRFVSKGDIVYDIGANIGLHTSLLSSLVGPSGHVYAFEPNPELQPALIRTVSGMKNGTLFAAALSDSNGEAKLFVAKEDHSLSSLANWTEGRFKIVPFTCERITLDDLVRTQKMPPPHFIKCDVEGAEPDVFRGALRILNRADAPLILFESNVHTAKGFGRSIAAARDFLAGLSEPGYQFFQADNGHLAQVVELDPVHSNLLAVPRSALDRVDVARALRG